MRISRHYFFWRSKRAAPARVEQRDQHFETTIDKLRQWFAFNRGRDEFYRDGLRQGQAIDRCFCVRGNGSGRGGLFCETVANLTRTAGRNCLRPWSLRRVLLQA